MAAPGQTCSNCKAPIPADIGFGVVACPYCNTPLDMGPAPAEEELPFEAPASAFLGNQHDKAFGAQQPQGPAAAQGPAPRSLGVDAGVNKPMSPYAGQQNTGQQFGGPQAGPPQQYGGPQFGGQQYGAPPQAYYQPQPARSSGAGLVIAIVVIFVVLSLTGTCASVLLTM